MWIAGAVLTVFLQPVQGDDIAPLVQRAERLLANGQRDEAEQLFLEVTKRAPTDARGYLGLCRVRDADDRLLEAISSCRQAFELDRSNPEAALELAERLAHIGALQQASLVLEDARSLAPDDPRTILLSALVLRDLGKRQDAAALLEAAVEHGMKDPAIYEQLSFLLLSLGERDRLERIARRGLELFDDNSSLEMALGIALREQGGRNTEAIELLESALSHGVVDPLRAYVELGDALLAEGQPELAVTRLQAAAERYPDAAEIRFRLGKALAQAGDREGAAKELSRFQEMQQAAEERETQGRRRRAALNEAQEMALQNRLDEALARTTEILDADPNDARACALQGKVLASLGRNEEALASIRKARALEPGNVEHRYLEARLLAGSGARDEAQRCLEEAYTLDPSYVPVLELLGVLHANRGEAERAIEFYQRALALGDDSATLHLNLAEALRKLGRIEESARHMKAYEERMKDAPGRP